MAEDAFRGGLRGIFEKKFGVKVERWITIDEGGLVYGFKSVIEVDIAIKDRKTMLIEMSSSVDKSKVAAFLRKAQSCEKRTGIRPDRLIMVTPYAEDAAVEVAEEVGLRSTRGHSAPHLLSPFLNPRISAERPTSQHSPDSALRGWIPACK
jgi:hypothetical protein